MGDRIQKLESLVSSLVRASSTSSPNGDAAVSQAALSTNEAANGYPSIESALQPTAPYGAVVPTTEGHHFIGESHWEAVLRDVRQQCIDVKFSSALLISTDRFHSRVV